MRRREKRKIRPSDREGGTEAEEGKEERENQFMRHWDGGGKRERESGRGKTNLPKHTYIRIYRQ